MKNVLITGKNSYIGTSVEKWLMKEPDKYKVDTVDMKDGSWKDKDFSIHEVVFHVAGIASVSSDPKIEDFYYKVNRDLKVETSEKFMSDCGKVDYQIKKIRESIVLAELDSE